MSDITWTNKDLGPVDAYALAVAGGYTGTKEQWIEEIANASTNASNAEAYAKGTRGGEAVASDDPAYHNNAEYYNGLAQTAKTAAQDAAETASAAYNVNLLAPNFDVTAAYPAGQHVIYDGGYYVLPAGHTANETWANTSKTQLTVGGENSDLKSALNKQADAIDIGYTEIKNSDLEQGGWSNAGVKDGSSRCVRVNMPISVKTGDTITADTLKYDTSNPLYVRWFVIDGTGTIVQSHPTTDDRWSSDDYTDTVVSDGLLYITFRNGPAYSSSTNIDISKCSGNVKIYNVQSGRNKTDIVNLQNAVKTEFDKIVTGFYINSSNKVVSETGSSISKILVMPIKHGHKYLFHSTGGNRWRVCLGNEYNIYNDYTCDVAVANSNSFVGAVVIDNTSSNKDYAYIYYYNGSSEPIYNYTLIDLNTVDVMQSNIFPGMYIKTNGTVGPLAYDQYMLVVPLQRDTDYRFIATGGNRRAVALSTEGIPTVGSSVYILNTGSSTDKFVLQFNSGNYDYLYFYYYTSTAAQTLEMHYELVRTQESELVKIYRYTDYHSNSTTENTGIPFTIGEYNVAKFNNDSETFIPNSKLHNLKEILGEMNADVLVINEDLGYIDSASTKTSHDYVFRPVYPYCVGSNREKIYSKIPFTSNENKDTPNSRKVTFATISVSSKTVLIVCVHAKPGITAEDKVARSEDLTWLISQIGNMTYDYCILAGDFNPEAGDDDLSDMETKFGNANMIMLNGGRFDYNNTWFDPLGKQVSITIARQMPLDYIITSNNIICNSYKVYSDRFDDLYSDHVPTLAKLTLIES